MPATLRFRRLSGAIVLSVALAFVTTGLAQGALESFQGRSLSEALRMLQAQGLRIVFTTTIVTPQLRVATEPRATTPRRQLDELLAPHGLQARGGPGGTLQVVRAKPVTTRWPAPRAPAVTGAIDGLVVHALTRMPIAGVVVRVDDTAIEARTDSAGRFALVSLNEGVRILHVSAPGFILVTRTVRVTAGETQSVTLSLAPADRTYSEHLTINGVAPIRRDPGVASETGLDRQQWGQLHNAVVDQPFRAIQAFPRVSAVDDFHGEFAVRGSPFRHIGLVIDGVSTHWLLHTAHARGATASLAMLTGWVLEQATLSAGAFPRRHGDRLGAQLELTLRDGSRDETMVRGALGGHSGTIVAEGPLGRAARGSWLAAARQSYGEWPGEVAEPSRPVFGFFDGFAKAVFDVTPRQQVALSVLGGRSSLDGEELPATRLPGHGTNQTSVTNLSWRSAVGSSAVLHQRAYVIRHQFENRHQDGRARNGGSNEDVVYRADFTRPMAGGVLEAGADIGRTTSRFDDRPLDPGEEADVGMLSFARSSWRRAAYAHFRWAATPTLTIAPGVRLAASTLLPQVTTTRWILGEWIFRPHWTLDLSAAVTYQHPEVHRVGLTAVAAALRPERATHVDVGIEQQVTRSVRWQATLFRRHERDIMRAADAHSRLAGEALIAAFPARGDDANGLRGSAWGLELLLDRRSTTGLSGWAAYSFGKARYRDDERHESFWADFDQRHAFTLFGAYRFSDRTSIGTTFRAGSNYPIPGYLVARNGVLYAADRRNEVRLPAYRRLDIRADRGLEYLGKRMTLFVEWLNVLNHSNVGLADGLISPSGEAIGFTDALDPRRATAGILVEF